MSAVPGYHGTEKVRRWLDLNPDSDSPIAIDRPLLRALCSVAEALPQVMDAIGAWDHDIGASAYDRGKDALAALDRASAGKERPQPDAGEETR